MPKGSKLTDRQKRFCQEYLVDLNATRAAERAGYAKSCINVIGPNNIVKSSIKAEIGRLQAEKREKTDLSMQWVLENLCRNHERALETDRIADSNKALELIGRHFGGFKDRLEIDAYAGHRPPPGATERSKERIKALKVHATTEQKEAMSVLPSPQDTSTGVSDANNATTPITAQNQGLNETERPLSD